jgi:hypothetical protein
MNPGGVKDLDLRARCAVPALTSSWLGDLPGFALVDQYIRR